MSHAQKHMQASQSYKTAGLALLFMTLVLVPLAVAKRNVDFDPNLDFSKFKTFAFIGGTNTLEFKPLNPNRIRDSVHSGVAAALVARGLKEVNPDQNPDLVVRYWANSQSKIVESDIGAWDQLGGFVDYYWAYTFDMMSAESSLDATLVIDLIDIKRKDLAWRLYVQQKIVDEDSIWGKVLAQIGEGFESYPPSPKEVEEKKKQRAEHPPKPPKTQPL